MARVADWSQPSGTEAIVLFDVTASVSGAGLFDLPGDLISGDYTIDAGDSTLATDLDMVERYTGQVRLRRSGGSAFSEMFRQSGTTTDVTYPTAALYIQTDDGVASFTAGSQGGGFSNWTYDTASDESSIVDAIATGDEFIVAIVRDIPDEAPSFTDSTGDAISGDAGTAITDVTVPEADGTPDPTYAASGLPAGLSFDTDTRVISGTPTASGSGTITIRATNSEGAADWTVDYDFASVTSEAPSFADSTGDDISVTAGRAIHSITVPEADGTPDPTYAASGLPAGLSFDTDTRVISGTPTTTSSGTITVTATNTGGTADWTADWTITDAVTGLEIDGVAVPVASISLTGIIRAGGDYRRLASGKLADGSRRFLRVFAVATEFMGSTDYDDLRDKVDVRIEQDITGDLTTVVKGCTRFTGSDQRNEERDGSTYVARRLRFEILESDT